jgi:hypothetical protein
VVVTPRRRFHKTWSSDAVFIPNAAGRVRRMPGDIHGEKRRKEDKKATKRGRSGGDATPPFPQNLVF